MLHESPTDCASLVGIWDAFTAVAVYEMCKTEEKTFRLNFGRILQMPLTCALCNSRDWYFNLKNGILCLVEMDGKLGMKQNIKLWYTWGINWWNIGRFRCVNNDGSNESRYNNLRHSVRHTSADYNLVAAAFSGEHWLTDSPGGRVQTQAIQFQSNVFLLHMQLIPPCIAFTAAYLWCIAFLGIAIAISLHFWTSQLIFGYCKVGSMK